MRQLPRSPQAVIARPKTGRRKPLRHFRPRVEQLEDRWLLSHCGPFDLGDGHGPKFIGDGFTTFTEDFSDNPNHEDPTTVPGAFDACESQGERLFTHTTIGTFDIIPITSADIPFDQVRPELHQILIFLGTHEIEFRGVHPDYHVAAVGLDILAAGGATVEFIGASGEQVTLAPAQMNVWDRVLVTSATPVPGSGNDLGPISKVRIITSDPNSNAGMIHLDDVAVVIDDTPGSPPPVPPSNLVVDITEDENDGDFSPGDLSLREAISLANQNPDANTITFNLGAGSHTIMLGGTQLPAIQEDVTITGGQDIFISGANTSRIFEIAAGAAVQISGLSLHNGNADGDTGGAITNAGTLALIDSTIQFSSADHGGGIFNGSTGTLTVTDSTISSNSAAFSGGGVDNFRGTLTVTSSTIAGNWASFGGGIDNGGTMAVTSSTIVGNRALGTGGGAGTGGGIRNGQILTVTGSTIVGNRADDAVDGGGGIATVGSSQSAGHATTLYNTIVAGNVRGAVGGSNQPDDIIGNNVQSASAHNLIGDAGTSGGLTHGTNGNIVGDGAGGLIDVNSVLDTMLADNGGPTQTLALVAGSPAIDAGDNALAVDPGGNPLIFDQRGFVRIVHGGIANIVDIGAVEFGSFAIPQTLIVDIPADENDGNFAAGDLALREAIFLANLDPAANTIIFDNSLAGATIRLSAAYGQLPTIDSDVTITGLGADQLTVDAQGQSRIFEVASAATVEISGLTLTGGNVPVGSGGAILNQGGLTVTDSIIRGNSAGLPGDFGSGGGILNSGTLVVIRSTIRDNSAGSGGGIFNQGSTSSQRGILTVTSSTISGNSSSSSGGGIRNNLGMVTVTRSTISGNLADIDGGGIDNVPGGGTLTVTSSTVVLNYANADGSGSGAGGGIQTGGTNSTTLHNTIVAGNARGPLRGVSMLDDLSNNNVDPASSHNLIGDSGTSGGLSDGTGGNIVGIGGIFVRSLNQILNTTLADNGGPTQTHALFSGSPAINAGSNALAVDAGGQPLTFDQRGAGFPRVVGGTVDIGAFEFNPIPQNLVVDTVNDEIDNNFSPGDLSLREAIFLANLDRDANTITFNLPQPSTIALGGTQLPAIREVVTITGPGAGLLTVDAGGQSRIFEIAPNTTANINGLTLSGGNAADGGGVLNRGTLTVTDSGFIGNTAFSGGGAIANDDGATLTVTGSTLDGNSAGSGGGIANGGGSLLTMTSCTLNANDGIFGGGIFNTGTLTLTGSTLSGNSADNGGGIRNAGTLSVTNSTFSDNSARTSGGGIFNSDALTVTGGTFALNRSDSDGSGSGFGGGIGTAASGATTTLNNTLVAGNVRGAVGGDAPADLGGASVNPTSAHNLIGDPGTSGGLTHSMGDNVVGNGAGGVLDVNSVLDTTLADYGGPTLTHVLVPGSPAINTGSNALAVDAQGNPLTTDQRGAGFPRISSSSVDIGAFELDLPNQPPTVSDFTRVGIEDRPLLFLATNFTTNFSDPDGDALAAVRIESLPDPVGGTLQLNGLPVAAGQVIAAAEINNLVFVPTLDFTGQVQFTYTASDGTDFAASHATVSLLIQADAADLEIEFDMVVGLPSVGGVFGYLINVVNNGPQRSGHITVTTTLDPTLTYVAVPPGTPTCPHAAGVVTCTLPALDSGHRHTLPIFVQPQAAGPVTTTIAVTSTTHDQNPANNTATQTTVVIDPDADGDGVLNNVENAGPNFGDANSDGRLDSTQAHVASLPNSGNGDYVTLVSVPGTLGGVQAAPNPAPATAPAGVSFPLGFLQFTVAGVAAAGSTRVELIPEHPVAMNTYYKYGPTPGNPPPHWFRFLFNPVACNADPNACTGAELIDANGDGLIERIVLHFVDGQLGDADAVAGSVSDPGGPGLVVNTPPTAQIAGPESGVRGQTRKFTLSATDSDVADEGAGFSYTIRFGDGSPPLVVSPALNNGLGVTIDHVFAATGTYTVEVTATDQAGNVSPAVTHAIDVLVHQVQPDLLDPSENVLVVGGTEGGDSILFWRPFFSKEIAASLNGQEIGRFADIDRVEAFGQGGNDTIVSLVPDAPAIFHGGDGDDQLVGGLRGSALLVGGLGDDRLYGSLLGRNVLIGGEGADRIHGGLFAENLLIGGTTTHDERDAALRAIFAEWMSEGNFDARVNNLTHGGGANGDVMLEQGMTVFDDLSEDVLFGGLRQDWFLSDFGDVVHD